MHKYEVGQLYIPGVTHYPEVTEYNFRGGQHELLMRLKSPSPREIKHIRQWPCEFALAQAGGVLFFLYRFGEAIQWSDAPFDWWRVPESERQAPPIMESPQQRAILNITLIDASTGIIHALRTVSLSHEFTVALHQAIQTQIDAGPVAGHEQRVAGAYRVFPTTADLLKVAGIRTAGGE